MFSRAFASPPITSYVDGGHQTSNGGGPSFLVITIIGLGVLWLLVALARPEPTVVVVQQAAGSFWGLALIAAALGLIWFVLLGPGPLPI